MTLQKQDIEHIAAFVEWTKDKKTEVVLALRILEKVKIADSGCWEFQGSTSRDSYGNIRVGDRTMLTHRVMAILMGILPESNSSLVLHKCDNKICCNPDHLELGTYSKNLEDAVKRGLRKRDYGQLSDPNVRWHPQGEKNGTSKLTENQIREIRESDDSVSNLRKKYGLCKQSIYNIRKRISWTHVQ